MAIFKKKNKILLGTGGASINTHDEILIHDVRIPTYMEEKAIKKAVFFSLFFSKWIFIEAESPSLSLLFPFPS